MASAATTACGLPHLSGSFTTPLSKNKVQRVCISAAHGANRGSASGARVQLSDFLQASIRASSSDARSPLQMDPASVLLRQRIVFLGSQVDDISADLIISQLLLLDAQDPEKDIKMFINSPGGSVSAGMGIHDAMKLCRADVSTICFGLAASMGAFLLASGTKGKRYCMPNARVMIHQPLGGAGGVAIDVGLQVREMMYHKVKLNKILSRLTGNSEDQIEADTDRDYFMNAWEAVEYGLVDAVVDDGKPGLVAPIGEPKEPPKTRVSDFWQIGSGGREKTLKPTEEKTPNPTSEEGTEAGREPSSKEKTAV